MSYTLRPEQGSASNLLLDYLAGQSGATAGLFAATGFGKTLTALYTALRATNGPIFILSPRSDISKGWLKYSEKSLSFSGQYKEVPKIEEVSTRVYDILKSRLQSEANRKVVITHYGSMMRVAANNKHHLKGKFFILDEAHHSPLSLKP